MHLNKGVLDIGVSPVLAKCIKAFARNTVRQKLAAAGDITALVNNTAAGTPGATVPVVPMQTVTGRQSGSNIVPRAEFNSAVTALNNAISVIAQQLNVKGLAVLELPVMGLGNGTIVTPGTVAVLDVSMTASAGVSDAGLLRGEMNASFARLRNNLAKVTRAYNILAYAIGQAELLDNSGGYVGVPPYSLENAVLANTVVLTSSLATADVALKVNADAGLVALANGIATLISKINTDIFLTGTRALDGDSIVVLRT